jgi:SSS family solute:Na+ symporter
VVVRGVTRGMFPATFPEHAGAVPPWLSGAVVCGVVLFYVFAGGLRSAAWANAFQTCVFVLTGLVALWLVARELGGVEAATARVVENAPGHLTGAGIGKLQYATYMFVPLSVGTFPHVFQHWLTARDAKSFRLTAIAHPIFILLVWLPCILIGVWAVGAGIEAPGGNPNAVLPAMVASLERPVVSGILVAGILAAIMSTLDSQFVCLGTMFTQDVVVQALGEDRIGDRLRVLLGRAFIVAIVALTYALSLFTSPKLFDLGVWCFSGFTGLFPLVLAAIYWRRVTKAGAVASMLAMVATWSWLFYDGFLEPSIAGRPVSEDHLVWGMMPVAVIFAASALVLVLVSLVTEPPPARRVECFMVPR